MLSFPVRVRQANSPAWSALELFLGELIPYLQLGAKQEFFIELHFVDRFKKDFFVSF